MFEYFVQRVRERTQSWHTKFLSHGGKEVLLKSIAMGPMAMSTYEMSCLKLLVTICHEIDSILSQFWWRSDESRRRIPWVAWKRMSFRKKEDLGFETSRSSTMLYVLSMHGVYLSTQIVSWARFLRVCILRMVIYVMRRRESNHLMDGDQYYRAEIF